MRKTDTAARMEIPIKMEVNPINTTGGQMTYAEIQRL